MLRNAIFSVSFITVYLFMYCEMLMFENTSNVALLMLLLLPVLLAGMMYTILKPAKYDGEELDEKEYGYRDWS
jgi:hypothetical protein